MARITMVENLSADRLKTISRLAIPSKTSSNEKNMFIARTARTSSVAAMSMYEYQFQIPGTKKCHTPNPMEMRLPIVVSTFIVELFINQSLHSSISAFFFMGRSNLHLGCKKGLSRKFDQPDSWNSIGAAIFISNSSLIFDPRSLYRHLGPDFKYMVLGHIEVFSRPL